MHDNAFEFNCAILHVKANRPKLSFSGTNTDFIMITAAIDVRIAEPFPIIASLSK